MVETKEVYFNDRPPETRFYWHTSLCVTAWSNIRIFEDKSWIRLDKPMDTYGLTNPRFVIEYSNIRIRPSQNALHWLLDPLHKIMLPDSTNIFTAICG